MPWCPKCKSEYEKGIKLCDKCNVKLVEKLESEQICFEKEEYLMTTNDEVYANMIETLLHDNNIPMLRKYRGSGEYLKISMGTTIFGIDIYVPGALLSDAKEIIEVYLKNASK